MKKGRSATRIRATKAQIIARTLLTIGVMTVAGVAVVFLPPARSRATGAVRSACSMAKAVIGRGRVQADSRGRYTNVVFLHHSVGHNLIRQGHLRELLTRAGYRFYDHGYNSFGLVNPDGSSAGYSYLVPGDNTDPDGLARIFQQRAWTWPVNTLSGLLQHEVVVIKSCYTAVQKLSDEALHGQKAAYLSIRDAMDRHPEKVFVVMTSPPANPAETDAAAAGRTRALAGWMSSSEFRGGHRNIYVFDLFSLLAENDPKSPDHNMLHADYRNGGDSHPNRAANEAVAPALVDFIAGAVSDHRKRK